MRIPRFWQKAETQVAGPSGDRFPVRVWGWSAEGVEEAAQRAKDLLGPAVERAKTRMRGHTGRSEYYLSQPPREEYLGEVPAHDGGLAGVLTRNAYGSVVLNTSAMMFVDVDRQPAKPQLPKGIVGTILAKLFGQPPQPPPEPDELDRIRNWSAAHQQYGVRLYETRAGYRVAIVNRAIGPESPEAAEILEQLGSDPLYRRLCKSQECFRARLSPKPWRVGVPNPPGKFPRENAAVANAFEQWVRDYEAASSGFATCRFIESSGPEPEGDAVKLIELHDKATHCFDSQPLG